MMFSIVCLLSLLSYSVFAASFSSDDELWHHLNLEENTTPSIMSEDEYFARLGFMSPSIFETTTDYFSDIHQPQPSTQTRDDDSAVKEEKLIPHQNEEILPTFSNLGLLSPSIFQSTTDDYFSLPKHTDEIKNDVTPQESPHRYIANLFSQPNARSPFERSLSRRGRLARNRSAGGKVSEQREHICGICGDVFFRKEHYNRHLRTVHSDEKPFECHICHITMSRTDNIQQHIRSVHKV